MTFAGKDQQRARHFQRVQRALQQVLLADIHANVFRAAHHVCRRFDFVDLENRRFVVINLLVFPRRFAAKVRSIVEGQVIVAPIGGVLDSAGTGRGSFEARGLRDQPVGHVAAVAITGDREAIGISNALMHQRINAIKNVAPRTRDQMRRDLAFKLVAVAG